MMNGNAARDNKNISSWLTTCWRHRCAVVKYIKHNFFMSFAYSYIHIYTWMCSIMVMKDLRESRVFFSPPFCSETKIIVYQ